MCFGKFNMLECLSVHTLFMCYNHVHHACFSLLQPHVRAIPERGGVHQLPSVADRRVHHRVQLLSRRLRLRQDHRASLRAHPRNAGILRHRVPREAEPGQRSARQRGQLDGRVARIGDSSVVWLHSGWFLCRRLPWWLTN